MVGLVHVAVVRPVAEDRDGDVHVGLLALRRAFGVLICAVAVACFLALVDGAAAARALGVAAVAAVAAVARAARARGRAVLGLVVLLLGAVLVAGRACRRGRVRLVDVAVVRV